MIKSTRMIVITKKKIISAICILTAAVLCVITACFVPRRAVSVFANYEKIIDTRLTPSADTGISAEISRIMKDAKNIKIGILKHFFAAGDVAASPEPSPESFPVPEQTDLISSESRRADKGLEVSNRTDIAVNPSDFVNLPLAFEIGGDEPQILIMHTHTTESFSEESYAPGSPDRNLDETKNITAVGREMAEIFRQNGIPAIHDTTVHDYPAYNGSYQRAAATIQNNLSKYGGIKIVLDIHRDGITKADGTKVKLVTEIDGVPTAQIMLVVGTNATLVHDNWRENFKFASQIQAKALEMYPTLMRAIDLRQERFNEHLTKGSLIIEIGTNGNTLDEAVNGGKRIAEVISAVLK